jgi:hypothetical protein
MLGVRSKPYVDMARPNDTTDICFDSNPSGRGDLRALRRCSPLVERDSTARLAPSIASQTAAVAHAATGETGSSRPQAGTNRRLIADYFGGRRLSSGQPASHCEACRLFFAFSAGLSCGLKRTDLILRDLIYYEKSNVFADLQALQNKSPINQAAGKTARAAENRRHVYNRSRLAIVYLGVKRTKIFFPGQYSFVAFGVIAEPERNNFSFR